MFFLKKAFWFALPVGAAVAYFGSGDVQNRPKTFHSAAELAFFKKNNIDPAARASRIPHPPLALGDPVVQLEIDSNILFPSGRVCGGCHGRDTQGIALVTQSGREVNMYDDWRASIMGNSARDPFWRAKVEHESLTNPAHAIELQDKCTSCHAPTGHYQAKLHNNKPYYGLAELLADSIGQDGVNCQACHAQAFEGIGSRHSGDILFDTTRVAYGPYEQVFLPPMQTFVGITPKYGDQILDAGLCASCHTLLTKTVDLAGQPTGGTFIEQATYHEWLNSKYKDTEVSCQNCHLPRDESSVIIADNYVNITPKYPFGIHELAGGNTLMLNVLKQNRAALGIEKVTSEMFDSSIAATTRMLQNRTLYLSLTPGVLSGDTAFFDLKITNKAGHKFPSGYPSRRAFVQFLVKNAATGDLLFESGAMNADFSLKNEDPTETLPHFDIIRSPLETQVYEFVAGDVNGEFTTVLERGAICLKDNRLPPLGFTKDDARYDTTRIVGAAGADPDFNKNGAAEGSGSDVLHFHIPINGFSGKVDVTARVLYQSIPPKWLGEIFSIDAPLINNWKSMYYAADRTPITVAEASLSGLPISPVSVKNLLEKTAFSIYPNPSADGRLFLKNATGEQVESVKIFATDGRLVFSQKQPRPGGPLPLPAEKGTYLVTVDTRSGRWFEKAVRL